MCIGVPFQAVQTEQHKALCQRGNEQRWIDTSLVGEIEAGDWLLVFLDAAREVLSPERAQQVEEAVGAIERVMAGQSVNLDDCFKDLVEREPQLPDHLKPLLK
ncbi:HypC/HybG/HupF family hydrogenase formation chaperone [Alteromonas lipolytica]|uniref:Hydrogenase n=1 Tax=Alteromonas lipolytica TaxID=1856405 RepID=A0A1E8FDY3_9ALTE|nr:HypC/HybG/HupF family hydrogenase formation chaperone [Alteromonas lipolytica]OFI34132.1 hydrogenase [Alteromonas lipolytica]GGF65150.1 hydrogenase expression/formation protein HupF [Alteromonas lipolytica]